MDPIRILHWEGLGFLYLLAAILALKLLTRQIKLDGLLARKHDGTPVSPERIQLLAATIAVCVTYIGNVIHSTTTASLPDVSSQMLYVFAGSSGIYASVKAFTTLSRK
jgi:hypothetical protein